MPPLMGTAPPTYPNPAPRVVTGILRSFAKASTEETSAVDPAKTTTSGKWLADHLSPEWLARVSVAKLTLPLPTSAERSAAREVESMGAVERGSLRLGSSVDLLVILVHHSIRVEIGDH